MNYNVSIKQDVLSQLPQEKLTVLSEVIRASSPNDAKLYFLGKHYFQLHKLVPPIKKAGAPPVLWVDDLEAERVDVQETTG